MQFSKIKAIDDKCYLNTFGERTPVCFDRGEGIYLFDGEGKKYADFFSGIAVNALGYAHPRFLKALTAQAKKLIHVSNLYYNEPQALLAKRITSLSCADRVFFANSGAEANEGAVKLARMYFYKKGMPGKNIILTAANSFHGRTLAMVAATGQPKYQEPYKPLCPGFSHIPLNDIGALDKAVGEDTAALMLEPIQGESGIYPADIKYIKAAREICNERGALLIFDEIQTGMGRTGKLFAHEHFGVSPDIFTLAKALGGGVPIGAVCARERFSAFEPGDHGTTFGGGPLACAAAEAVFDILEGERLVQNAAETGEYFKLRLSGVRGVGEVRGLGLMLGISLPAGGAPAVRGKLFERGYLVGAVGDKIIRLLPPLIITKNEIDMFIDTLGEVLS